MDDGKLPLVMVIMIKMFLSVMIMPRTMATFCSPEFPIWRVVVIGDDDDD